MTVVETAARKGMVVEVFFSPKFKRHEKKEFIWNDKVAHDFIMLSVQ